MGAKEHRIAAVDLFCGAGGLSLGLKSSGISVVAGIDLDPDCKLPFEKNIKAKFVHWDVKDLTGKEVLEAFGSAQFKLIAACAPCQPFSGYSLGKGRKNKDWGLLLEVLRLISEVKPDFVTIENVPRLAREQIWKSFVRGLESLGYNCDWSILDASKFGVPQTRHRLVLVGSLHGELKLPKPTHSKPITVRQAIGELPPISAGQASAQDEMHVARSLSIKNIERIKASKPGGTWRSWPKSLRAACHNRTTGKSFPSVYGRMDWDEPSPTITTQFFGYGNGRFGHPSQHRAISLREGAILQSFPRNFVFAAKVEGGIKQLGKLIGNAVPPKLAKQIGKSIISHAAVVSRELPAR